MELKIHSIRAVAIAILLWNVYASAQALHKAPSGAQSINSYASCYEESTGKLIGSHRSRTTVLVSPDGRFRAYAESEAIASDPDHAGNAECQNTSRLFVANAANQPFRVVLDLTPSPEMLGNSIDLIDWSPKGHRLLLGQGVWQWGSDAGATTTRIYDADTGRLSSEGFIEKAFRDNFGIHCIGVFQPVGFSPKGAAVIKAGPYFDIGEEGSAKESCVRKEGLWMVDSETPRVDPLPPQYKGQHYGKNASAAP